MNELAVVLAFFAAPGDEQVRALPSLPGDPGAPNFYTNFARNPLLILVESYHRFLRHSDVESWEVYGRRIGLPAGETSWPSSVAELNYVLETIRPQDHMLWNRKALERRVEWRVVRRLARVVLDDFGWPVHVNPDDIQALLKRYGPMLAAEWREEGRTFGHHGPPSMSSE